MITLNLYLKQYLSFAQIFMHKITVPDLTLGL